MCWRESLQVQAALGGPPEGTTRLSFSRFLALHQAAVGNVIK